MNSLIKANRSCKLYISISFTSGSKLLF